MIHTLDSKADAPAQTPSPGELRFRNAHAAALALVLAVSFGMMLHNLDHAAVRPLDEVFHAIVARGLMHHPLRPTLDDPPYIAVDSHNWQDCEIWLHKPPMAMWQIAISYALLGVSTFSLRLPSAILATAAVWLTYKIAAEVFDRNAGLLAALLQAFNPGMWRIVQGYVFSDAVDISLLFWTELSVYFLLRALGRGRRMDAILCGVAQGLAFLSKTYPALIVTALALIATIFPGTYKLTGRRLFIIIVSLLATILPWNIYAATRYPAEYFYYNGAILSHLTQNVEGWGAPWDRLIFDFSIRIYHIFYVAVLASAIVVAVRAWQKRELKYLLMLVWGIGVLAPFTIARSKTMTATMVGWPPFWILLGGMASLAIRGDRWAAGVWLVAMFEAVVFITRRDIPIEGWGYPAEHGWGIIMRENIWVAWQWGIALLGGGVIALLTRRASPWTARVPVILAMALTLAAMFRWPAADRPRGYALLAWQATLNPVTKPDFADLASFAARLPANAVFLVDDNDRVENKLIQFATDRTAHHVVPADWPVAAREVLKNGGIPYVMTGARLSLPVAFVDHDDGQTVYLWTPPIGNSATVK